MSEAIVAAIGGWLLAAILAITAYRERQTEQKYRILLQALDYLTGGSQKRSIGIALVEGLWERKSQYLRSLLPALINQAVYLLLSTKNGSGRHQFHNWLRIMELILRAPKVPELFEHYTELSHALFLHIDSNGPLPHGINVTKEVAEIWFKKINEHAEIGVKA